MERDKYDFFKGKNKAKKYDFSGKSKMKDEAATPLHYAPMAPFATDTASSQASNHKDFSLPIPVKQNGKFAEWEFEGEPMRHYFQGNIWLNNKGNKICWAFFDRNAMAITSIKPVTIEHDANGDFVVITSRGKEIKTYIKDALRICFPASIPSDSSKVQETEQTGNIMFPKKPKVTLVQVEGDDLAFYHEPIENNEYPFWVSKKGGRAYFGIYDWHLHQIKSEFKPYNVQKDSSGRKYISVKQKDGSWKKYDLATAICTVFNGKPTFPDMFVKFLDGNPENCDANNLYWDMPFQSIKPTI